MTRKIFDLMGLTPLSLFVPRLLAIEAPQALYILRPPDAYATQKGNKSLLDQPCLF